MTLPSCDFVSSASQSIASATFRLASSRSSATLPLSRVATTSLEDTQYFFARSLYNKNLRPPSSPIGPLTNSALTGSQSRPFQPHFLLIAFPWPLNAEIKKKKAKDASKPTKQEGFGTVLSRGPYLFASAAGSRNSIAKKNEKR